MGRDCQEGAGDGFIPDSVSAAAAQLGGTAGLFVGRGKKPSGSSVRAENGIKRKQDAFLGMCPVFCTHYGVYWDQLIRMRRKKLFFAAERTNLRLCFRGDPEGVADLLKSFVVGKVV